jgi:hypothetical protein
MWTWVYKPIRKWLTLIIYPFYKYKFSLSNLLPASFIEAIIHFILMCVKILVRSYIHTFPKGRPCVLILSIAFNTYHKCVIG